MNTTRLVAPVAALLLALLTACGGSSSPSSSPATSASSSNATAPADEATAKAQITANWEKFFDYQTPNAQAVKLLEDGPSLGAALQLAKKEQRQTQLKQAAKVKAITFTDPTRATVSYQLLNGKAVLLGDATGTAVLVGGTWKVSKQTFCSLVTLGNNGKAPAGC